MATKDKKAKGPSLKERLAKKKADKEAAAKKDAAPPAETKKDETPKPVGRAKIGKKDDAPKGPQGVEKDVLDTLKGAKSGEGKDLTQEPRKDGEETVAYMERILVAVSDLTDGDYGKLPDGARTWFEQAAKDWETNKSKVSFPDAAPADAPADKKDDKAADTKAETKKETKKEEKKDADNHEREKSPSSVARIIVCEKLGDISLEDLIKACKERGIKITDNQAHAVHNITKRVLKTLKALGYEIKKK